MSYRSVRWHRGHSVCSIVLQVVSCNHLDGNQSMTITQQTGTPELREQPAAGYTGFLSVVLALVEAQGAGGLGVGRGAHGSAGGDLEERRGGGAQMVCAEQKVGVGHCWNGRDARAGKLSKAARAGTTRDGAAPLTSKNTVVTPSPLELEPTAR